MTPAERGAAHPELIRHGTATGYRTYGCKCKPCCQASTEYQRAYRRLRARLAVPRETRR